MPALPKDTKEDDVLNAINKNKIVDYEDGFFYHFQNATDELR